jgi:hypothetical protein
VPKLKLAEKDKQKLTLPKKNQLTNSGSKHSINSQPREIEKQSARRTIEKVK